MHDAVNARLPAHHIMQHDDEVLQCCCRCIIQALRPSCCRCCQAVEHSHPKATEPWLLHKLRKVQQHGLANHPHQLTDGHVSLQCNSQMASVGASSSSTCRAAASAYQAHANIFTRTAGFFRPRKECCQDKLERQFGVTTSRHPCAFRHPCASTHLWQFPLALAAHLLAECFQRGQHPLPQAALQAAWQHTKHLC